MLGWIVLAAAAVWLAAVLIRAVRFTPKAEQAPAEAPVELDGEKIVRDMQDMIRCRTVSHMDEELTDWAEFEKFQALLRERFPLVHEKCALQKLGKTGLLYRLPGLASNQVSVCMAHYDVVPVNEAGWSKPAFDGILEDGVLWGRGTLDTKGTVCGIFEALEQLLSQGYVPKQDLYLSLSGDEETSGDSCPAIVRWFEEQGIRPALVVDEGGAVVDHVFPGVPGQCALIGISEKGGVDMEFSMDSQGGHASTPPPRQLLGHLSRAVLQIEKSPFPSQLTKPTRELFDTLGRHSTFLYRVIFANLWCFKPVVDLISKVSGGEFNAMMRTTVAITRFAGSDAYNVMPPKASFGVNIRLLGEDTMDTAMAYLKRVIKNEKIRVRVVDGMNPSPCSDTDCAAWKTLKTAVRQTWPEAIVSPYLMMACSDSRHYNRITDRVYRFSAMHLSKQERASIHGNDERVPVETLVKTAAFYVRLMKLL